MVLRMLFETKKKLSLENTAIDCFGRYVTPEHCLLPESFIVVTAKPQNIRHHRHTNSRLPTLLIKSHGLEFTEVRDGSKLLWALCSENFQQHFFIC